MNERNLVDLLIEQTNQHQDRAALKFKKDGRYQDISWNQFLNRVSEIAVSLKKSGVKKGDRVAIYSENRPEWVYADLATLSLGAISVPLYPTASVKDVEHVLNHAGVSIIFVSNKEKVDLLSSIKSKCSQLRRIVIFESLPTYPESVVDLAHFTFFATGEKNHLDTFKQQVSEVALDDLATIIYTSGTTGPPKGVMLTHRNFLINCYDAKECLPITDQDLALSFLPLSHVFERMGGYYLHLLCGLTIAYAENMNTVPENLVEVKPTISCGVPRFFEKIYARILEQVNKGSAVKRAIFKWALKVGSEASPYKSKKQPIPFFLNLEYQLAQRLVYHKIYEKLGGRLRCFISGSAPLAKELAEFFYSVGVLILEGYGLTETSPVISVNRWEHFKFGSVGLPLKHVELKLAADGEIIVRGPSIMQGYYQNEAATREAIKDGWFYTGDFGKIDEEGFLYITGRKKDVIKTSGGKMISPQNIEGLLLTEPLISQVVLVGDKQRFLTALIVPNFEQVKLALHSKGEDVTQLTPVELVQKKSVHDLIRARIDDHSKALASFEQIKFFTLLPQEFSQASGELTITLKMKRNVIAERFKDAINRMYTETDQTNEGRDRIFYVL